MNKMIYTKVPTMLLFPRKQTHLHAGTTIWLHSHYYIFLVTKSIDNPLSSLLAHIPKKFRPEIFSHVVPY